METVNVSQLPAIVENKAEAITSKMEAWRFRFYQALGGKRNTEELGLAIKESRIDDQYREMSAELGYLWDDLVTQNPEVVVMLRKIRLMGGHNGNYWEFGKRLRQILGVALPTSDKKMELFDEEALRSNAIKEALRYIKQTQERLIGGVTSEQCAMVFRFERIEIREHVLLPSLKIAQRGSAVEGISPHELVKVADQLGFKIMPGGCDFMQGVGNQLYSPGVPLHLAGFHENEIIKITQASDMIERSLDQTFRDVDPVFEKAVKKSIIKKAHDPNSTFMFSYGEEHEGPKGFAIVTQKEEGVYEISLYLAKEYQMNYRLGTSLEKLAFAHIPKGAKVRVDGHTMIPAPMRHIEASGGIADKLITKEHDGKISKESLSGTLPDQVYASKDKQKYTYKLMAAIAEGGIRKKIARAFLPENPNVEIAKANSQPELVKLCQEHFEQGYVVTRLFANLKRPESVPQFNHLFLKDGSTFAYGIIDDRRMAPPYPCYVVFEKKPQSATDTSL